MELTIYILCHNRPDYARQAIRSVLEQTSSNFYADGIGQFQQR